MSKLDNAAKIYREAKQSGNFMHFDLQLEYILSKYNIEEILDRLNVEYIQNDEKEFIQGFCPDHYHYKGVYPSDPKWYINRYTGKSICWTESRKSNLIEITKNLMKFETLVEARDFLLRGERLPPLSILMQERRERIKDSSTKLKTFNPDENEGLNAVRDIIAQKEYDENLVNFFKNDGITEETIKEFNIVSINNGKLKGRALIPFYDSVEIDKLVGYVCVEVLGKKNYVRKKVSEYIKFSGINKYSQIKLAIKNCRKHYKKVLFCKKAPTMNHLFGFNNLIKKFTAVDYVILVEGERDAIKLQQEGFNAVGTHGTHLTKYQKDILHKAGVKTIYICYDADQAGKIAADKVYKSIATDFNKVEKIILPDDKKDPKLYNGVEFMSIIVNYGFKS